MLLTVTTTHRPAPDLGYLLHSHPDRVQEFKQSFGSRGVERYLETKTRLLVGWKGYSTNLTGHLAEFVIRPAINSDTSRSRSGCPSTTYAPARLTTANAS